MKTNMISYRPTLSFPWCLSGFDDVRLLNLLTGQERYLPARRFPAGWLSPIHAAFTVPMANENYKSAWAINVETGKIERFADTQELFIGCGDGNGCFYHVNSKGVYYNGISVYPDLVYYQSLTCRHDIALFDSRDHVTHLAVNGIIAHSVPGTDKLGHRKIPHPDGFTAGYNSSVYEYSRLIGKVNDVTITPWKSEGPPIYVGSVLVRPAYYPKLDTNATLISAPDAKLAIQLFSMPAAEVDAVWRDTLLHVVGCDAKGQGYYEAVSPFAKATEIVDAQELPMKKPKIANVKHSPVIRPNANFDVISWEDPENGQRFRVEIRGGAIYVHHEVPGVGEDHTGLVRKVEVKP